MGEITVSLQTLDTSAMACTSVVACFRPVCYVSLCEPALPAVRYMLQNTANMLAARLIGMLTTGSLRAPAPPTSLLPLFFLLLLQVIICDVGGMAAPMPVASLTQKGWCPRSVCSGSGDMHLVPQRIR
jgi:hypothetical protein